MATHNQYGNDDRYVPDGILNSEYPKPRFRSDARSWTEFEPIISGWQRKREKHCWRKARELPRLVNPKIADIQFDTDNFRIP